MSVAFCSAKAAFLSRSERRHWIKSSAIARWPPVYSKLLEKPGASALRLIRVAIKSSGTGPAPSNRTCTFGLYAGTPNAIILPRLPTKRQSIRYTGRGLITFSPSFMRPSDSLTTTERTSWSSLSAHVALSFPGSPGLEHVTSSQTSASPGVLSETKFRTSLKNRYTNSGITVPPSSTRYCGRPLLSAIVVRSTLMPR